MRSKITIDTAPNFKPCIRVQEPQSHHLIDSDTEDVRDKLVKGFRELLHHTSSTVEVIREGDNNYILFPVGDELAYIEKLALKWLNDADSRQKLGELAKRILEASKYVTGTVVMTDKAIAKLRDEGMLTYTAKV